MLPDIESLRCFDAAARLPSFRAAARSVHLSPAAFSDRIRALEESFGTRLFERTTRRVALTSQGLRLVPQARRCLEEADRCKQVVSESSGPIPFDLVLGTRFELGLSWLVPALPVLESTHPERTLHLSFADGPDLLERVERGVIDAAITSTRFSRAGLAYLPLHEERYVFVGAAALLKKNPLRSRADAAGHVLLDAGSDLPLFRYFQDASAPPAIWAFRRVVRLGAISAIRQRVLDGFGVAVLPRYLIAGDLAAKRVRPIQPRVELLRDHFRLIWRQSHPHEKKLVELAGELRRFPLR